ncbi:mechanosensitive ion channel [Propionibacteriaceae bacterium Y1685]|uniref:mechanosensitive ion channel n=1 Tax=Microlunatus sp. Y1700 TaxID=3418487 RepID=UPI003B7EB6E4
MGSIDWLGILQKVAIAAVIILATWLVASLIKWAMKKLVGRVKFLQRSGGDGQTLGESLGKIAGLIVWLFGLVAVLQVFSLDQVLAPIQQLLGGVMGFLPNLIGAIFVFVVGSLIAKVARQLIEMALSAVNFDKWLSKLGSRKATGPEAAQGNSRIARTIGTVVYALIMIVVAISALQILGIAAISDPATQMLNTIFTAIPNVIAALLLLALGGVIARFAGELLQQVLEGIGTNRALAEWNIVPADKDAAAGITRVAQVAIVLFFAVMAAQVLNFPQVTAILNQVLALGGQVIFGGVIIAAGFFIANLVARLVGSGAAATIIRWVIVVLFAAMGLKFMGIADSIIELGFGAVVVGGALAAALAFGLGGRETAGRLLQKLEHKAETTDLSVDAPGKAPAAAPAAPAGQRPASASDPTSRPSGPAEGPTDPPPAP